MFFCVAHMGLILYLYFPRGLTPPPMLCRPNGLINIEKSFEKSVIWMVFLCRPNGLINIEKSFEKSVIWMFFLCRPHGANSEKLKNLYPDRFVIQD